MCPRQAQPQPTRHGGRSRWRGLRLAALLAAALLSFAALAQQPAQAPTRIGYIDMKRVLDNAPQMHAGRALLQREFTERDAQLKTQEARLLELQERQRRDSAILPKDTADALAQQIETLDRGIRRMKQRLREELAARQIEESEKIYPAIQDAVIEYSREQGLDLVVQSPVVYASATIDITDAVLARLKRDFDARKQSP
ncbi:MAG TPA: OmpH family outer membrane protein [Xanthomonadales bacterium]|nr:OmpH family outer membrane protein [Xanthomonadales bacterium]